MGQCWTHLGAKMNRSTLGSSNLLVEQHTHPSDPAPRFASLIENLALPILDLVDHSPGGLHSGGFTLWGLETIAPPPGGLHFVGLHARGLENLAPPIVDLVYHSPGGLHSGVSTLSHHPFGRAFTLGSTFWGSRESGATDFGFGALTYCCNLGEGSDLRKYKTL